jgi:hypothetical protein
MNLSGFVNFESFGGYEPVDDASRLNPLSFIRDVPRMARLAVVEVTGPRLAAVSFDELAMFFGLHDRFEGHLNRFGSALRSQDFLRP